MTERAEVPPMGLTRATLWRYCQQAAQQARVRAREIKVPFAIDAHFVDQLLVDQKWTCAVSGLPFEDNKPFGPSLDRIVPELGYVPGNLRVVCYIANIAMNAWGLDALKKLMAGMNIQGTAEQKSRYGKVADTIDH
jgi:hypothetical protein